MRLVQLQNDQHRCIAIVDEPNLLPLEDVETIYDLAQLAITNQVSLSALAASYRGDQVLAYDPIYTGISDWRILPPINHPEEPARCLISGTGLTHLGSAKDRNTMHEGGDADITDSMKMFQWGVEQGKPVPGEIGIPPEWFYKGNGAMLSAHGMPLIVPSYANDGGEEGEIAGIYIIGPAGNIYRIGMAMGNEFSDHVFEKKNYLNLAGSKMRMCSLGPEIVIDPAFDSVKGRVQITRKNEIIWSKAVLTGEDEMCHSLQNIEHHHFKFEAHRRPGDIHIHFYGACSLSFGDNIALEDQDLMEISFEGFGRPLRNRLQIDLNPDALQLVQPLR